MTGRRQEGRGRGDGSRRPRLSVIVPVYDEENNVEPLNAQLAAALEDQIDGYEVIFVDDGSADRTCERLRAICRRDPRVRVLRFARNHGQTAALQAGFDEARGEILVTLDGDLQNDPVDIGRLLERVAEGYDVVAGWRRRRREPLLVRRVPSLVANWLLRRLVGSPIHDTGCALKAYRREIVDKARLYGEMHRYLVPILQLSGGRVTEVPVTDRARRSGSSKYGLSRIWKVLLDLVALKMLVRFSSHPAVWFAILGFPFLVLAIATLVVSLISWLGGAAGEPLIVAISVSCISLFASVQLLLFGMIAEQVVRLGDYREADQLLLRIETREGGG